MSDTGQLVYDKDAVYIKIADHRVAFTEREPEDGYSDAFFFLL
jgi:hypothetical protein